MNSLARSACVFFFFQAEDGIRDWSVTGVQTCALRISAAEVEPGERWGEGHEQEVDRQAEDRDQHHRPPAEAVGELAEDRPAEKLHPRSEERRVGKECRSRWSPDH